MTTDDLLTAWTSHLRARGGRATSTTRTYQRHVVKALDWIGKPPVEITLIELSNYLAYLDDCEWLPNSRRVAAAALRSFFKFLAGCRTIPHNVAADLPVPRGQRREVRTLKLELIQKIVLDAGPCLDQTPRELRDRLIFGLSYALGLRAHEATWLRLDEVDIDEKTVSVLIRASKHGRQDYRRPIHDHDLAGMLLIYMDRHRREMPASPWLFPSRQADRHGPGGRLSVRQIQRIFHSQLAKAGVRRQSGYRHHMLRASLTTHSIESGADFHIVQQWLRHGDGSTTLLYARTVAEKHLASHLFARRGLGPRQHRNLKLDMQQDLGSIRPKDRGSGRLSA